MKERNIVLRAVAVFFLLAVPLAMTVGVYIKGLGWVWIHW